MNESAKPERRRWLQFRLRTLLIAVLVLSLPLSWFAMRMERARRQRDVLYACNVVKGSEALEVTLTGVPRNSFWCTVLGDDFFDSVTSLTLMGDRIDDSGLESLRLENISGLTTLALADTKVTSVGLQQLRELRSLECLIIKRTPVTDAGLEHLRGLTNLERLQLHDTQVTPEGARRLQEALPNCEIEY